MQHIYQADIQRENNGGGDSSENTLAGFRGSRTGNAIRRWRHLQHQLRIQEWVSSNSYNAFRYSMVLLYIGTMLVVLGYHNTWLGFIKYVGLALVTLGGIVVCYSCFDCFKKCCGRPEIDGDQSAMIHTLSSRVESADSKMGLPSYDIVAGFELPTYEEAEELRLHPDKIPDDYVRRLSLVLNSKASSASSAALRPPSPSARRHSFPRDAQHQSDEQPHHSNSATYLSSSYPIRSPPPRYVPNPIFVVENSPIPSPLIVELHESLQQRQSTSLSSSFENLPEIHLSNCSRPRFHFHPVAAGNLQSSAGRRRLRSSSITPVSISSNLQDEGEDRLRVLRQSISARPQTSALSRGYSTVFESDDDEICEVLEDESEDDLHVFDDSEGSDWDSGSTRNPRAQ